ncbi:MAG: glycosyltransferase family 4 protein [Rhizobiaceae bacterium]
MSINASSTKPNGRSVLIIVENLPVPFDRRVWQEATALKQNGYGVSVICPKGKGHNTSYEVIDGINIYRHSLPLEASGAMGYLLEYSAALFWQFFLSCRVLRRHGFDVIHACNPPDLIFVVASFFKTFFGKKFLFDQHDLNPELYVVKFGRKGFFHRMLQRFERWTFQLADVSIATNETFKSIAVSRGGMAFDKVWVVKSYPDLDRFKIVEPNTALKKNFKYLIGYVGIMAEQDGVDYLVNAMAHLVHKQGQKDIGCVVIGDGPELANLRNLAVEKGVADYVKFTGYLSGNELLGNLCALDIGVIPDPPNDCNDKLSMNKVFEYMALGLPFVQYDLAQSRSEAGEAALIAQHGTPESLANGIEILLKDGKRRAHMSAYGMERAQREFQWKNEVVALTDAYAELWR